MQSSTDEPSTSTDADTIVRELVMTHASLAQANFLICKDGDQVGRNADCYEALKHRSKFDVGANVQPVIHDG